MQAETLLAQDERHRDVIFPYLNGEDLNSHPEQKPSRYVINFFDWPLERTRRGSWWSAMPEPERKKVKREGIVPEDYPGPVAADYPDILAIVKERVYPVRAKVNRKAHRKYWWHYGDKRPLLYATIAPLQRVLVIAEVSKYIALAFIPGNIVFSHMTVVFAADDWTDYAVLQSSFHDVWARQYSSSMGGTLRYTPTDIFQRLPFPAFGDAKSSDLPATYHEHRRQVMLDRWEGLTKTYNRFHDRQESAEDIGRLRELHVEMDHAVAAAYGWTDLELGHGFHETKQGIRYTIHPGGAASAEAAAGPQPRALRRGGCQAAREEKNQSDPPRNRRRPKNKRGYSTDMAGGSYLQHGKRL